MHISIVLEYIVHTSNEIRMTLFIYMMNMSRTMERITNYPVSPRSCLTNLGTETMNPVIVVGYAFPKHKMGSQATDHPIHAEMKSFSFNVYFHVKCKRHTLRIYEMLRKPRYVL